MSTIRSIAAAAIASSLLLASGASAQTVSLVEHQGNYAAVHHARPALESIRHLELRHRAIRSRHERQAQAVEVERPAPEAVTVEADLHPVSRDSSSVR